MIKHTRTDISRDVRYLNEIRKKKPLVHCITNTVTICDCANMLLAAGASPTMAHHPLEVAEITEKCNSLVCNFGAMDDFEAMLAAAPVAERCGHPILVDPVGCGGSTYRRERFRELAGRAQITCIRGNASEITALYRDTQTIAGVDAKEITSEDAFEEIKEISVKLAQKYHCIVITSGATDIVTDGNEMELVKAGDAMMTKITGAGCMLSALTGAFLAIEKSVKAAAAACRIMGYCGECAADRTKEEQRGTMTFHTYLIDEMSLL